MGDEGRVTRRRVQIEPEDAARGWEASVATQAYT